MAAKNIFLKIDTQGFKESILASATNSLKDICGFQLELPIRHLFAKSWSLWESLFEVGWPWFCSRSNETDKPSKRGCTKLDVSRLYIQAQNKPRTVILAENVDTRFDQQWNEFSSFEERLNAWHGHQPYSRSKTSRSKQIGAGFG
jgi:hypothetical protein